jgi:hypothetical protein
VAWRRSRPDRRRRSAVALTARPALLLAQAAAHVGGDLAVDAEAAVDAVGVEAREDEVGERAADHDDLAVGLQRHAGAVAAEASSVASLALPVGVDAWAAKSMAARRRRGSSAPL